MTTPIRIELPMSIMGTVNVYLFPSPEPTLIDAGFNSEASWDALLAGLAQYHLHPADLKRVIITHTHADHLGLAARIAQAGAAQIFIEERAAAWLYDFPGQWDQRTAYYRAEFLPALGFPPAIITEFEQWMAHTRANWQPIPEQQIATFAFSEPLLLGDAPWQVLDLPGHDSHLTGFYQAETRSLLSSDALIIPTATAVITAPSPGQPRTAALPQMMESLQRLAALEIDTVFPGHGEPFGDHRTVIAGQLQRIEERTEACYAIVAGGAMTVATIFADLYGERAAKVGAMGVWMVVGYLDRLLAAGRIQIETIAGVWHFRSVA
jgi:glyoxylase-like metal-dependent hydrolase (beta-lactamase superfamily II)